MPGEYRAEKYGVHPTPAGHQLIANAWLGAFERKVLNA